MVTELPATAVKVSTPVIDGVVGARCTINGKGNVLNFASCNFWGLAGDQGILVCFSVARRHFHHVSATDGTGGCAAT